MHPARKPCPITSKSGRAIIDRMIEPQINLACPVRSKRGKWGREVGEPMPLYACSTGLRCLTAIYRTVEVPLFLRQLGPSLGHRADACEQYLAKEPRAGAKTAAEFRGRRFMELDLEALGPWLPQGVTRPR